MSLADVARAIDFLRLRKRNYQLAFSSPAGQAVMNDLATFCRAAETCVVPGNHDRTLLLEGRREVWLRITEHLRLNQEQLFALYAGQGYNTNLQEKDDG